MIRFKNVAIFKAHFEAAGRPAIRKWVGAQKIKIAMAIKQKKHFFIAKNGQKMRHL